MLKNFVLVVVVVAAISGAQAEPTFQLDASGARVVSLSNLYNDPGCSPGRIRGKVVKRQFDDGAIRVTGFVIENADGSRDFVNVGVDTNELSGLPPVW
jgi:hypothetical protein